MRAVPGRVALSLATLTPKATSSETVAAGRSPGPPKAGTAVGTENRALVGDALELVVVGVGPYLDRVFADHAPGPDERNLLDADDAGHVDRDLVRMLGVLARPPAAVGDEATANAVSGYARELQAVWDAWARIRPFDAAETYRALDTAARLLVAIGAVDEAEVVRELATVPLALFAARTLAEYVAEESARQTEPVAEETGSSAGVSEDETVASAVAAEGEPEPRAQDETVPQDEPVPDDEPVPEGPSLDPDVTRPVRLRAVNHARHAERVEDAQAPASIRALRVIDPALPLVTWSELSDTITALLATGRLDPEVLAGFTRKSLDERARAAVEGAVTRGITIRPEHVAWVVSVLRARYAGSARVTRAAATALVAEYIAELAPRAGVDPRRVRQDMMAWVDVERA